VKVGPAHTYHRITCTPAEAAGAAGAAGRAVAGVAAAAAAPLRVNPTAGARK